MVTYHVDNVQMFHEDWFTAGLNTTSSLINATQASALALLHANSVNFANFCLSLFPEVDTNSNSVSNTGIEILVILAIMVWKFYEFYIDFKAARKWAG